MRRTGSYSRASYLPVSAHWQDGTQQTNYTALRDENEWTELLVDFLSKRR